MEEIHEVLWYHVRRRHLKCITTHCVNIIMNNLGYVVLVEALQPALKRNTQGLQGLVKVRNEIRNHLQKRQRVTKEV